MNIIRKIIIWILGLPIILVLVCFVTIAAILTGVGTLFFRGVSILAIMATGFFILVKAMPINTQLISIVILSVLLFWIPELMAIPMTGAMLIQRRVWDWMIE